MPDTTVETTSKYTVENPAHYVVSGWNPIDYVGLKELSKAMLEILD